MILQYFQSGHEWSFFSHHHLQPIALSCFCFVRRYAVLLYVRLWLYNIQKFLFCQFVSLACLCPASWI